LANIATSGRTSAGCPLTIRKPAGICIQALAIVMNAADSGPLMTIGSALSQWARGESFSQPYR
jgi:hypothetical protein